MPSTTCTQFKCYVIFRCALGLLDFILDLIHAVFLFVQLHPFWATLTLIFSLTGFIFAAFSVKVGQWQRGDGMSKQKFFLLSMRALATIFEGLFESGPQLILQVNLILHGIHTQDMIVIFDEHALWSWPWFRGLIHSISLVSSFGSLVVTMLFYNEERWDANRPGLFMSALFVHIFCCLYRIILGSVMFAIAPFYTALMALTLYTIHVMVFKLMSDGSWEAILFAYASLYSPSGHTKSDQCPDGIRIRSYSYAGVRPKDHMSSDLERVKINHESLLKRVRNTHIAFFLVSLLLLIPYILLLELCLFKPQPPVNYHFQDVGEVMFLTQENTIVQAFRSRLLLYLTPLLLMVVSILGQLWNFNQCKFTRDAIRQWCDSTPARSRSNSRSGTFQRGRSAPPSLSRATAPKHLPHPPLQTDFSDTESLNGAGDTATLPLRPPPYNPHTSPPVSPKATTQALPVSLPPGCRKCGRKTCITCDLFIEGSVFKSTMTGKVYRFMTSVTCDSPNVVYLVTCGKCKKQYVGKTDQTLRQRHYGHRREIELQSTPLGKHFALDCGYTFWRMQIIDQTMDELGRREGYWQHELMTLLPWGLNTRDELNGGMDISVKNPRHSAAV